MPIIRNEKTYYTLEESIKISDKYIEKSANNFIFEPKKNRVTKIESNKLAYV